MKKLKVTSPFIVISETSVSVWSYHLRQVGEDGVFLGGKQGLVALCGAPLGWDTSIPLSAWKCSSHLPQTWCSACEKIARQLGVKELL
jgi:hypothetical protein